MTTSKMILGLIAGMAIGAIAGLLIAPARGADTRRKLQDAGSGLCDNFKKKYNHLIDDITSTLDAVAHEETPPLSHDVNHTSAVL